MAAPDQPHIGDGVMRARHGCVVMNAPRTPGRPATRRRCVVARASGRGIARRMVVRRRASIDFPAPAGPRMTGMTIFVGTVIASSVKHRSAWPPVPHLSSIILDAYRFAKPKSCSTSSHRTRLADNQMNRCSHSRRIWWGRRPWRGAVRCLQRTFPLALNGCRQAGR